MMAKNALSFLLVLFICVACNKPELAEKKSFLPDLKTDLLKNHEKGKLIVEGVLKDERFGPSHLMTGEIRPPGTLHHMIVRMVVAGPGLGI